MGSEAEPLLDQKTPATADYAPVRSVDELKSMFWSETVKLWKIAGPTVTTILRQSGTNFVTSVFVGHLGDVELSAVTITLTVIGTFCFGFLVILLSPY